MPRYLVYREKKLVANVYAESHPEAIEISARLVGCDQCVLEADLPPCVSEMLDFDWTPASLESDGAYLLDFDKPSTPPEDDITAALRDQTVFGKEAE